MRQFWKGDDEMLAEFANRFTGSSDLYLNNWRTPTASINFITAHDGFTMMDLVSYNEKHNESNGENNNDGENHNRSFNYGVEGPTDDARILAIRKKQIRNFITTLFLSEGIPMLLSGDEMGRTQNGNNNAYCQDNELNWVNWDKKDEALIRYTSKLIHFRLSHPVFCRKKWFQYKPIKGKGVTDIEWFLPEGTPMSDEHWNKSIAKSLTIFLSGEALNAFTERGEPIIDDTFMLMINSSDTPVIYTFPAANWGSSWFKILDSAADFLEPESKEFTLYAEDNVEIKDLSFALFKLNR
jgi:glycogen operon protein